MRKIVVSATLVATVVLGGPAARVEAASTTVTDPSGDAADARGDIVSASVSHESTVTLSLTVQTGDDPSTSPNWKGALYTRAHWPITTVSSGDYDYDASFTAEADGTLTGVVTSTHGLPGCAADATFVAPATYQVSFPRSCIDDPASLSFVGAMEYDATPSNPNDAVSADNTQPSSRVVGPGTPTQVDREVRVGVVGADDGQLWSGHGFGAFYEPFGGQLIAAPAIGRIAQPGDPSATATAIYVGTGTDHHLWARRGSLEPWRPLSTNAYCKDSPGAVVHFVTPEVQHLTVACRGSDDGLWTASAPVSPTSTPELNVWTSIGGILTAGPGVSLINNEPAYLVTGVGGRVYQSLGSGFSATPWACKGHPAFGTFNDGDVQNMEAWFGCHGTDDGLWVAKWDGSAWLAAFPLGGYVLDGPGVAVTAYAAVFFVQGSDNGVWQRVVQSSDSSSTPFTPNGGKVKYGVNATAL